MIKNVIAGVALSACATGALASQDPTGETCEFASVLDKGTDIVIGQLLNFARDWPEADRAKLDPIFRPELTGFKMSKGDVYRIADLGEFAQEYLVVSADRSRGSNIYFRIIFQTSPKGFFFKNVKFNTDFYKITDPAFVQEPEKVVCQ